MVTEGGTNHKSRPGSLPIAQGLEMLLITCFIFGLLGSLAWAGPHGRSVCPSGTFANRDRSQWYCYKFYEDMATFQEAEEECHYKWRGHLASFTRDKQAETIGAYINKENIENNHVWIGLQRENMVSTWSSCL
uniref:C-type lectin domain-containing protein n=2 Tax=Laticauda laticaudata TaxID=8630 RepID=A0A8C5SA63_LATLA